MFKIILGEVYDYVVPASFDVRIYSFLSSVKRRENKRDSVKHKPASMRVIVFIGYSTTTCNHRDNRNLTENQK